MSKIFSSLENARATRRRVFASIDSIIVTSIVNDDLHFNYFVNLSRWSIFSFSISNTSNAMLSINIRNRAILVRSINFFSDRRVERSFIQFDLFIVMLEEWVAVVSFILRSLVLERARYKVLCLLYHYRYLNDIDLIDLFSTNLIIHRVRVKFDVKSTSNII